ncbi:MAG: hypothetical protein JW748_15715 [Anaerolineales bacterium]|nr:hypothetical protein [Anaerolineales bacterium]
MDREYSIGIIHKGRSGEIIYREDGGRIVLCWEFGGGRCVAILYGPSHKDWDAAYPWARGRREMIYRRVGEYVRGEKARRCLLQYDFINSWIEIISPD